MKKFLSVLLSGIIFCTALAATGCDEEDSSSSSSAPVETEAYVELKSANEMLTLGDRLEMVASYDEIEGETISWSSSNPSVVSIDANGVIEALMVGKATITARYGNAEDTCDIEVGLSGNVPTIAFNGNMRDEVTLMKSSVYDFGAHIRFNGKTFTDAELEYYVVDETIATIQDGKLETKQKTGSTQVSVAATWRGQTVHAKTIIVNVIADTMVLLDSGMTTAVELYTANEHEGQTYATTKTISSVFVFHDGAEIKEYELAIADESIASIEKDGNGWKITAGKAGQTHLIVSFAGKQIAFGVQVLRPMCNLDVTADYSISDGKYFDEDAQTFKPITELIAGFNNIVSYEYDGKESKLKNGVLALPAGEKAKVKLYSETVGYCVNLDVYTMLIDELDDFTKIYAGETKETVDGYFALVKDLIEPEYVLTMPSGMVANNFAGVFDGRGHVLSFTFEHTYPHRFGLFGGYLNGAVIKNFALHNITKNATGGKNPAGIICGEGADGSADTTSSILENIYVDLTFSNSGDSNIVFMGNLMWKTEMKNIIVHVPIVPEGNEYGSFARGEGTKATDCYVISTAPLYKTTTTTNFKNNLPKLYESYEAMKAASNDYTSFSAEYWDTTTHGVPVWKGLVEEFGK